MNTEAKAAGNGSRWKLSLDTWAVLTAFLVALLIRAVVLKHLPW